MRRRAALAATAALACAPLWAAQAVAPAAPSPPSRARAAETVTLDAASSEVDYRSNTVLFRDVVITQGNVRVAAGRARATGLDFDDATWTFSEDVRIDVEGGKLRSGDATVTFARNRVARAVIRGAPASFEQRLSGTRGVARGRAGTIEYDLVKGTVRLSQDAWLSDGRSEIRGKSLVYDLAGQRVEAGAAPGATAGGQERVQITIRPRAAEAPAVEPAPPR
jgi:lipopolysaccharide transport protein LptA